MTMADEIDQLDNAREMGTFQLTNNNNSLITNQNMPWKQRKRKRLSAVLDKLHNNNTITKRYLNDIESHNNNNNNNNNNDNINNNNNNNNNTSSSTEIDSQQDGEPSKHLLVHDMQRSVINAKSERESIKSGGAGCDDDDDRTTNASDDFRSSIDSPHVKREAFGSPFDYNVNDENAFNGENIKQEERTSGFEYPTLNEQQLSSMERYLPQIPLFEYYLQTKWPDMLRMQNLQLQQGEQKSKAPVSDQQCSPVSQDTKTQQKQAESTVQPRKRQKQSKHHNHHQHQQQYAPPNDKASPPPQEAPLDLSMKTILQNIAKATATHKHSSKHNAKASTSTNYNRWQHQIPQDLSTSIPSLANILMNQTHLNNHSAFAAMQRSRSPNEAKPNVASNAISQVPIIKGDVASPTTKESVAFRYNLNVSPVVEEMPPGTDVAYVCPICGQMFSLHDRLAKHMASRHKSKSSSSEITKSYVCEVCERSFARSDMLTRHMRLHTGIKPYTCKVCNQVFSRSDHLSTHQRTHTGEKPYKCPQCPYAACRRDMITRHMRTHARYEAQRAAAAAAVASQAAVAAAVGLNDTVSMDGGRMSFAQMQRSLLAGAGLSEVSIKMEEDAAASVSPRTLSPAYAPSACIKTENICS